MMKNVLKKNRNKKHELLLASKEPKVHKNLLNIENKIGVSISKDLKENEDLAEFVCLIFSKQTKLQLLFNNIEA